MNKSEMNVNPVSHALLEKVRNIAHLAGDKILEVYDTDFSVDEKSDSSPLTVADLAAHTVISAALIELTPNVPVLSEEGADMPYADRAAWECYWLVDPLDGTREFVKRNGEFTVNIALIELQQPVLGVVFVPVTGVCYSAARGLGAFKQGPEDPQIAINSRAFDPEHITVAGSRSHGNEATRRFIDSLGDADVISIGSSLKFCLVAEGKVDVYPRFGPTSEWDTAAAQCVVEEAGGEVVDLGFQPLRYNTKESLLNPHFLVYGDESANWQRLIKS